MDGLGVSLHLFLGNSLHLFLGNRKQVTYGLTHAFAATGDAKPVGGNIFLKNVSF